jgi:hypothetical protein
MNAAQLRIRRKALEERRRRRVIDAAFEQYMDEIVARVEALGVPPGEAMKAVFQIIEHCEGEDLLPEFPRANADSREMGEWIVRAYDFGLSDFVLEAIVAGAEDGV